MRHQYPVGAGMIVFRTFEDGIKVLVLQNFDGSWDLPKGRLDPGESLFDCAVRETSEEASIDQVEFKWGTKCLQMDNLTFYMCSTEQDPEIKENPVYGNFEHMNAVWVNPAVAHKILPDFLKDAVRWAVGQLIF